MIFQTEAKFFATTALEAAEGLVEIREEYVEEEENDNSSTSVIESGVKEGSEILPGGEKKNAKDEVEDDEFARIMSKLKELEKEEDRTMKIEAKKNQLRLWRRVSTIQNKKLPHLFLRRFLDIALPFANQYIQSQGSKAKLWKCYQVQFS